MQDTSLCGLFGGAFDPVHHGHLAPLREVARAAKLKRVIYIPTARPPHRPPPLASFAERAEMVRIAIKDQPDFEVNEIENRRAGDSWTIDTVAALRRKNPRARYALILGMDALIGLEKWHRWRELQQSVHIIAVARAGWNAPQLPQWRRRALAACVDELQCAGGKIFTVNAAPVEISSTQVRARIKAGGDASDLMPRGVWEYICARGLYDRPAEV